MKYEQRLIKLASAYYTDERGVIFAVLVASGITPATAYYHAFHKQGLPDRDGNHRAGNEYIEHNLYIRELIDELRCAKKTPLIVATGSEKNTSTTEPTKHTSETSNRENDGKDVLHNYAEVKRQLWNVLNDVEGKDKAQVLVQLSKIIPQDDVPEENRVRMYLPFNSDCRQCALFLREKAQK